MKTINVLIAEDDLEARNIIRDSISEFSLDKYKTDTLFKIEIAESFQKASHKLSEAHKKKEYFHLFFCDIDFTEDGKGGERDSGYKLIEKCFETCPLTKIFTYSGQFRAKDLWPKHEELQQKGLIVKTLDKSHSDGGESHWIEDNLNKIIEKHFEELYLWDMWNNHIIIMDSIKNNEDYNLDARYSIFSNLEFIMMLLKNESNFDAKKILYRLTIHLYHQSLEMYCKKGKSDTNINDDFNSKLAGLNKIINGDLAKSTKPTSITVIGAFDDINLFKYGFRLNDFRNKSIHPNDWFHIELLNILYANLAISLYAAPDKTSIHYSNIKSKVDELSGYAKRDILELLSYIN